MIDKQRITKILYLIATLPAVYVLYTFIHETGHCIVAIACGSQITEFSIVTAHMSFNGGNYSDFSTMWFNANGALLPYFTVILYMLFYRKQATNSFYRLFSYFIVLGTTCSLLAWVFIPILYLKGNAPVGDDCTKFLEIFEAYLNPILVTISSLGLICTSILLMVKKRIIQNFIDTLRLMA